MDLKNEDPDYEGVIGFLYWHTDHLVGWVEETNAPRWLVFGLAYLLGLPIWTWLYSRPWRFW